MRAPAFVFLSLIIVRCPHIDVDLRSVKELLKGDGQGVRDFFKSFYKVAYGFFYNDFVAKDKVDVEYLGYTCIKHRELGVIRADFVLLRHRYFNADSLHIHFYVNDPNVIRKEEKLTSLVNFMNCLYNFDDEKKRGMLSKVLCGGDEGRGGGCGNVDTVSKLLGSLAERSGGLRNFSFGPSRYIYLSIVTPSRGEFRSLLRDYRTIWKLLYMHPKGVGSVKEIRRKLKKRKWGTGTDFFVGYHQPGAILTISRPYPKELYYSNREWFIPQLRVTSGDCVLSYSDKREEFKGWHEEYDLLPEYPPLRYLGLVILEYLGIREEVLRHISESLMQGILIPRILTNCGSRVKRSLLAMYGRLVSLYRVIKLSLKIAPYAHLYYRAFNMECLRLPVSRDIIELLFKEKKQLELNRLIGDLKDLAMNYSLLLITLFVSIFTIFSIVYSILRH